jgi:DNA polymerase-3 subunit delta'
MNVPWLDPVKESFSDLLDQGRLGHAPMLIGPAGLGKRGLADWLVARLLCLGAIDGSPCGNCRSCQLLESRSHPDLFVASVPEDKSQLTVDVIRALAQGLQLTPSIGPHRVGLIKEADQMNINAANALLKTLEEPSAKAWLVLVSDNPDKLPATVLSRCQKKMIRPPTPEVARLWLAANIPEAQGADIDLALEVSGGAPLEALFLLSEDGLVLGGELRNVLLEAAGGRLPTPDRIETWSDRAPEVWHWLAFWCRRFMSELLLGQGKDIAARPEALATLWQQALEGRAMADTNIRADLLLGKWLLEWTVQVNKAS